MENKKHTAEQLRPFQWKKGQSGNPEGRKPGQTIKELVREWLEKHPDDMRAFVKHFVKDNKELAWQMLEGSPARSVDVSVSAAPIPLLEGVREAKVLKVSETPVIDAP